MKRGSYIYPNLIAEMSRNGDNLKTLSQKIGMNYQTLSARLRGKRNFELPEIYQLMSIYGCTFETLFAKSQSEGAA